MVSFASTVSSSTELWSVTELSSNCMGAVPILWHMMFSSFYVFIHYFLPFFFFLICTNCKIESLILMPKCFFCCCFLNQPPWLVVTSSEFGLRGFWVQILSVMWDGSTLPRSLSQLGTLGAHRGDWDHTAKLGSLHGDQHCTCCPGSESSQRVRGIDEGTLWWSALWRSHSFSLAQQLSYHHHL